MITRQNDIFKEIRTATKAHSLVVNSDAKEYLRRLKDGVIDHVITDPPYQLLKHEIEQLDKDDIKELLCHIYRVMKVGGVLIYSGIHPHIKQWDYIAEQLFTFNRQFLWYKGGSVNFVTDVPRSHEVFRIYTKGRVPYIKLTQWTPYTDYLPTDLAELIQEFHNIRLGTAKVDFVLKHDLTNRLRACNYQCDINCDNAFVLERPHNLQKFNDSDYNLAHPTVKPLFIYSMLIRSATLPGSLILDPFAGTGTTVIAALSNDRHAIGVELFEKYQAIMKTRLELVFQPALFDMYPYPFDGITTETEHTAAYDVSGEVPACDHECGHPEGQWLAYYSTREYEWELIQLLQGVPNNLYYKAVFLAPSEDYLDFYQVVLFSYNKRRMFPKVPFEGHNTKPLRFLRQGTASRAVSMHRNHESYQLLSSKAKPYISKRRDHAAGVSYHEGLQKISGKKFNEDVEVRVSSELMGSVSDIQNVLKCAIFLNEPCLYGASAV